MPTMVQKFHQYHQTNPHVYGVFKQIVMERLARGKTLGQSNHTMCALREKFDLEVKGDFEFKINQIFGAAYVRMFELDCPQHIGFFHKKISDFDTIDFLPSLALYRRMTSPQKIKWTPVPTRNTTTRKTGRTFWQPLQSASRI